MAKQYLAPDNYGAALQLAQALADLAKNPKIIAEANEEFLKASQLSAEQKKEVELARDTLEQNKRTSEQLLQDKRDYKDYVDRTNLELDQKHSQLSIEQDQFMHANKLHLASVADHKDYVKAFEDFVRQKTNEIDSREGELKKKEDLHGKAVETLKKRDVKLSAKEAAHEEAVAKLDARKKRLAEAAKED